jgi:hypothetical protein
MASCSAPAPVPAAAAAATPYFPPELIPDVARRLTSLQDFFALRASCRAYRAALPLTPSNLASQAPLLLLVPGRDDQATESPALYDLPLRRLLRFRLPRARQDGTSSFYSLGCCRILICEHLTDPSRHELRMVHLLTGEETRIPSPVGSSTSFILSGDLLLIWGYYACSSTIQSLRPGDANWSVASIRECYNLEAMVCVNGTIYGLVTNYMVDIWPVYHLAVVELLDNRNSAKLVFLGALQPQALELPVDTELSLYPAECCGELILIVVTEYDPRVYRAFKWKSGEHEWVRIASLGGCALFFAGRCFVGCLGPDHPGIRKDCIYFNEEGLWSEYSSVDGSFRQSDAVHLEGKLQETFRASSVWVFPSIC